MEKKIAYYHLPGLFEFYEFYKVFLPLFFSHRDFFYSWCEIGSIYGAPQDSLWGGGRVGYGDNNPSEVIALMKQYGISSRLTFSNSLLNKEHLSDYECNKLAKMFLDKNNGIIVHSELLLNYFKNNYNDYYFVSSTTKVLTNFNDLVKEVNREEFKYVVPDFRLNKSFDKLDSLTQDQKDKIEFLCNECCSISCAQRKECYENVSLMSLGKNVEEHKCTSPYSNEGYKFSRAKKNPSFISVDDILNTYLPKGFSNFKIEGRSLGSALILEFILYYMTKPEYQLEVREMIYLDNSLDLF